MSYKDTIRSVFSLRPRGVVFLLFVFFPAVAGILVQQGLATIIVRELSLSSSMLAFVLGTMIGMIWLFLAFLYHILFKRIASSIGVEKHQHGRE